MLSKTIFAMVVCVLFEPRCGNNLVTRALCSLALGWFCPVALVYVKAQSWQQRRVLFNLGRACCLVAVKKGPMLEI